MLGFATVQPPEQGRAELTDLFVDPERWREGIGRRLLEAAVGLAVALGAVKMWTVGGPALPFYRRMGFRAVGEVATPLGPPGRLLELSLQAAVGR